MIKFIFAALFIIATRSHALEIETPNDVTWLASLGNNWSIVISLNDDNEQTVTNLIFKDKKISANFPSLELLNKSRRPILYLDNCYVCGLEVNLENKKITLPKICKLTINLAKFTPSNDKKYINFGCDTYYSGLNLNVNFGEKKSILIAANLVVTGTAFGLDFNINKLVKEDNELVQIKIKEFNYCDVVFEGSVGDKWSYIVTHRNF